MSDPRTPASEAARRSTPRRGATMREVAALAGVSIKTVSRVVRGEPGVSPELAARVTDAAAMLDYRHNLAASTLRGHGQKTAAIGLVLMDVANPFASALHRAVEDFAHGRGTLVFAVSSDENPGRQREVLDALLSRRVDGLIVMPVGTDHGMLIHEQRRGTPVVFVDRLPAAAEIDSVTVDNRAGARRAIEHLAAQGHRRIAYLGDLHTIWTAAQRYAGYVEGLACTGIALDPTLICADLHNPDAAEAAVDALLSRPDRPTALFSAQNLVTVGVLRALQKRGLHRDIALVSFDDLPLAELLTPALTAVTQDPAVIGRTAAELLFARLDGDQSPPRRRVVPTRLLVRGSGEIPPSGAQPEA
ncbi:LacI family transcriptional regulator [Nocardia sp. NEAU-G5]|uniref:LacI family transcriptional regulator n=1 Tax=Nocardia albiluteola TaxID=2842303 RepID=A0ABS6B5E1_9NOCA|nr:LacI family DNA-binding transcriptional regulator [Nocardia albiluteola]MBU3062641.1 LacI family transcriptional regulator [Nocardia albiluteola]MBU3065525.1 LacI family transcriptional regulator [Nocardia albiluteola]